MEVGSGMTSTPTPPKKKKINARATDQFPVAVSKDREIRVYI